MTATDRLRAMLDERGVEWMDDSYAQLWCTVWHGQDGKQWRMTENRSGMLTELKSWHVTPEQAIDATLGAVEYRKPTTLSQLEAENAKLREELELWHRLTAGIELPEYPFNRLRWEELERENAKLRELIRAMWGCISHIGEYDVFYYNMAEDGCGMSCTVNGEHCCADKLYDRMHELGVVDE